MAEPVFGTLRTKEQLGYSVHCSTRLTHGVLGFAFVVVSGAHAWTARHCCVPAAQLRCMRTRGACVRAYTGCAERL